MFNPAATAIEGQTIEGRTFYDKRGDWRFKVVRIRPDGTEDTLAVSSIEDTYSSEEGATKVLGLLVSGLDVIKAKRFREDELWGKPAPPLAVVWERDAPEVEVTPRAPARQRPQTLQEQAREANPLYGVELKYEADPNDPEDPENNPNNA